MISIKITDYKKKYNDALERARDLTSNQNCSAYDKILIEKIFPELNAEEDDENTHIKKVLFDYFQQYKDQEDCGIKRSMVLQLKIFLNGLKTKVLQKI